MMEELRRFSTEMKSLYDLPKDILVKMLTTLEQNIRKEFKEQYFPLTLKSKVFDKVMEMINGDYRNMLFADYHICNFKNCENYSIENQNSIYFSTTNIFFCLNCDTCFCETHKKDFDLSAEYCNECYLELP
jgi:hypothetical protein